MAHFTSIAPHHTMAEFKATPNKELRRGAIDVKCAIWNHYPI